MSTHAHSTTQCPRFVGQFARDHYLSRLVADAICHVTHAEAAPALDCTDLAALLRIDASAAYALLAEFDPVRLATQAACYAAYANELLDLTVTGEHVLTSWQHHIDAHGLKSRAA